MQAALGTAMQQALLQATEREQLAASNVSLAEQLSVCTGNAQAVVATLAYTLTLTTDTRQGLLAAGPVSFEASLQALHDVSILYACQADRSSRALSLIHSLHDKMRRCSAVHAFRPDDVLVVCVLQEVGLRAEGLLSSSLSQ